MQSIETHQVPDDTTRIRLQDYGVSIFAGAWTKSALKKAIKKGLVQINGVVAATATFVEAGDTITLHLPIVPRSKGRPNIKLDVLLEDDHLAIVLKPAGVVVSGNTFRTIVAALPQNLLASTQIDAAAPQPVHRLDYETSGLLLIGKTSSSIRSLNKMFEQKTVEKRYLAVTIGEMKPRGAVDEPVDGKASLSEYVVLASTPSERFGALNLVELSPRTGRRHQLRKHMLSLGNPILGDREYTLPDLLLTGKGLYLHAYFLKFEHPITGATIRLRSDVPTKFRKIFPETIPVPK